MGSDRCVYDRRRLCHLARKNGRLELIQQKMNEAKRERIVTPTLVIGMVLAVAFMVVFEIF